MKERWIGTLVLLAVLAAVFVAGPGMDAETQDLGVTLLAYLAVAQAWNILAGFAGQVSLGAAAFVATGGYTTGLVLLHTQLEWPVTVTLAAAASAAIAALLAVPLLRLRGDYFAIGSLAAAIAAQALLTNWNWAGGAAGITLPIDRIPAGTALFQLATAVAGVAMAAALYVRYSAFGLRLAALRDNEPAAAGLGVPVYWHRFAALLISGTLTGMAGAVVAYQYVAVSPAGVASVSWSLAAVLMALVGGAGSVLGPVLGVLVVYYGLTKRLENFQVLSLVVEGVLLVLIVRFAPAGVSALLARAGRTLWRLRHRPRRDLSPVGAQRSGQAPDVAPAAELDIV